MHNRIIRHEHGKKKYFFYIFYNLSCTLTGNAMTFEKKSQDPAPYTARYTNELLFIGITDVLLSKNNSVVQ